MTDTTIESLVFQNVIFDEDKLLAYGFKKQGDTFFLAVSFHENEFEARLTYDGHTMHGTVMDQAMEEEYLPLRVSYQSNAFAHTIREEYSAILQEIKAKCTEKKESKEGKEVTDFFLARYHDTLDYPFEESDYFVLRRENGKWYALFMEIPRNKLDPNATEEKIAVVNLKAKPDEITSLICEKGIYPSYHMNKKHWISVILDEDVKTQRLLALIEQSRVLTGNKGGMHAGNAVIIPANPSMYDIETPLDQEGTLLWHQKMHIEKDTTVYIYMTSPIHAIVYKTKAIETDIFDPTYERCMLLKKECKYSKTLFSLNVMRQFGLNAVRGARRIPLSLQELIEKTTETV